MAALKRLAVRSSDMQEDRPMTKMKAVSTVLMLGVAGLAAYSRRPANEYVAPSEAVPRGKAPHMKVQLLNPGDATKQYAVIFYQGDEAGRNNAGRPCSCGVCVVHARSHGYGRSSDPAKAA
jgi:hypothetical protein